MRKIKREWPREWKELANESRVNFEQNDCSVIAFALAYEMDYKNAKGLLEDCGRETGHGASWDIMESALRKMEKKQGVGYKVWDARELGRKRAALGIQNGKGVFWTFNNITTESEWTSGVYMLVSHNHIATMINGRVLDHAIDSKRIVVRMYEVKRDTKEEKSIFD